MVELSISLAREIAEKPIVALKELKRCFYESVKDEQIAAVQKELQCKPTSSLIPKSPNASRVFIRR